MFEHGDSKIAPMGNDSFFSGILIINSFYYQFMYLEVSNISGGLNFYLFIIKSTGEDKLTFFPN